MAAPEFVPVKTASPPAYQSPPRRPDSWRAERPGESLGEARPDGDQFGFHGPDQGFALTLANRLRHRLQLREGESADDALAGAVAIALRRASLFGRAPVSHDLTLALTLFGFLDTDPPSELVALRRERFAEVANAHHYAELRQLVASVPESTLRKSHDQVNASRWRDALGG